MSKDALDILKIVLDRGVLALVGFVVVAFANYLVQRRIEQFKAQREDEKRLREEEKERETRQTVPRTEFGIECRFYGPQGGAYVCDVALRVANVGKLQRKFRRIRLRIRTIGEDDPLEYWSESDEIGGPLRFPNKLVEHDMIAKGDYYYVEPGVKQSFTLVSMVPESSRFVLIHALFQGSHEEGETPYDTAFTEERLFEIPSRAS